MSEKTLTIDNANLHELFGASSANIGYLNSKFPLLKVVVRGANIKLVGAESEINRYEHRLDQLSAYVSRYGHLSTQVIDHIFDESPLKTSKANVEQLQADPTPEDVILYGANGVVIRAKTVHQKQLVAAYAEGDMMFAVGPAGSGKTYTAIALAVRALKNREVKKIILTRPAVEAGEKLGFLPGDMKDKLDPYLQPLYDALGDMMPRAKINEYMEQGIIQIAPLAYMRGRTLNDAVVILDEAQNTTGEQLKMFLTRMGQSAKFIITGDLTQVDLPVRGVSGLDFAVNNLNAIDGVSIIKFGVQDIMRHKIVSQIVKVYESTNKD